MVDGGTWVVSLVCFELLGIVGRFWACWLLVRWLSFGCGLPGLTAGDWWLV